MTRRSIRNRGEWRSPSPRNPAIRISNTRAMRATTRCLILSVELELSRKLRRMPGRRIEETNMKHPFLVSVAVLAMTTVLSFGQAPKAAPTTAPKPATATKSWTPPKTPWGDPDLQGTWTSDDCIGTPMNRAVNLGEKRYWTEQEL